jgi:hypothetical protein
MVEKVVSMIEAGEFVNKFNFNSHVYFVCTNVADVSRSDHFVISNT